jgi:hypothetical protein
MIVDHANVVTKGRKLGRVQEAVLKSLLEMGTYPGTWYWKNGIVTVKALESLHKRGLVQTLEVNRTDLRGDPDPYGRKVTLYKPVQWMLDVINETSDLSAVALLRQHSPSRFTEGK